MNWKWLLTGAEPRMRYGLLVAIGVVVMMTLTYSIWAPGGRGMAAFAAIAAVIISHISAKLIMKK
ncbi:MAG: putative membrane protein [Rhodobacteraceae bacterium HLUCCA12]|nr:MAG: putative membrane protein [Rhodobacteraceae bacterium HLUCCA12]